MPWTPVTIPRRSSSIGMPARCVYCFGGAEQDLPLRTSRVETASRGQFTVKEMVEHLEIDVPYCRVHAARSTRLRVEIRRLGFAAATLGVVLGLVVLIAAPIDVPLGVRAVFGVLAGMILGVLGLLSAGILVRGLPRYRDWGAGLLGIDLAAGPQALTFRFTNSTFAATFRTRNGVAGKR